MFPLRVLIPLLLGQHAFSQNFDTSLQLNASLSLNSSALSSDSFALPPSANSPSQARRTVSVALCSVQDFASPTRFFASNNSDVTSPGPQSAQSDVYELVVGENGYANLTLTFDGDGAGGGLGEGVFAVDVAGQVIFEVGVTNIAEPLHSLESSLPLLGDTTANQAILFSPPFLAPPLSAPSFPNYTLPAANLTPPAAPDASITPNYTILIAPTGNVWPRFNTTSRSFMDGSPVTACSLRRIAGEQGGGQVLATVDSGNGIGVFEQSMVLRDEAGWRTQWIVRGLTASTNYTAFVVQEGTKVSGPIYFATKSATFSCPLAHSLTFCPSIAYAVPLPLPQFTDTYTTANFPQSVSDPLIQYIQNFTTSLGTFPCGRDMYSPVVGCEDCAKRYRDWVCSVMVPRCGEVTPNATANQATATATATSSSGSQSTATTSIGGNTGQTKRSVQPDEKKNLAKRLLSIVKRSSDPSQVVLLPALATTNSSISSLTPSDDDLSDSSNITTNSTPSRNPNLPFFSSGGNGNGTYTQLLPCLELCNALERACPPFLSLACPIPQFDARRSYGVGYVDGDQPSDASKPRVLRSDGMGSDDAGGTWRAGGGVTGTSQDRYGNVWCNGNVRGLVKEG